VSVVAAVSWAILDGGEVPLPEAERRLTLERYADNPQLESLYVEDAFGAPRESPLYYVVD